MDDTDLPALYQSANRSSQSAQRRYLDATQIRLSGLVLAGIFGAFDLKAGNINLFALLGVVFFVVAVAAEIFLLVDRPDRTWYQGRAGAESVKTLSWRYAVGGAPFPIGGPHGDDWLLARLQEIMHDASGLRVDPVTATDRQVTPAMRQLRSEQFNIRRHVYDLSRIEVQRDWYSRKAQWNSRRAFIWSILAIVAEAAGIVAGAVRAFDLIDFDLLAILAAVAAGAAAWSQAKQYGALEHAYFVAGQELATVRSSVDKQTDETWPAFVDESEQAISREHTMWRAARGVRLPSHD